MAASLKIHPNTAHKVIQALIEDRWLEARPVLERSWLPDPGPAVSIDGVSLINP